MQLSVAGFWWYKHLNFYKMGKPIDTLTFMVCLKSPAVVSQLMIKATNIKDLEQILDCHNIDINEARKIEVIEYNTPQMLKAVLGRKGGE